MTNEEVLAIARLESQRRNVPLVQVLVEQLVAIHGAVERSDVLDMHPGCTPNGGCPVAAFRREYQTITGVIVPVPSTPTSSAPIVVSPTEFSVLNTAG